MKIKRKQAKVICCNCMQTKEGVEISYSNDSTLTHLCGICVKELTRILDYHSQDEWLRNETNY